MTLPVIVVVLVNYKGAKDTLQCIKALQTVDCPKGYELHVVVVDNASPDDSVPVLHDGLRDGLSNYDRSLPVELVESPSNGGFSAGNNIGIQWAKDHYQQRLFHIWLLNNDTQPQPNALVALVQAAEGPKNPVLAGSVLRYPDGRFQQGGIRINRWTGQLRGYSESSDKTPRPVDAVSGASLLIPRPVLESVGLLDESHFLYVEDVDYCLAAKAKGIDALLVPDSVVSHEEGASTGKAGNRASLMTQYYYQRNRMAVLSRYLNPLQWVTLHAYALFRWLRMGVKAALVPSRREEFAVLTRALCDYSRGRRFASF